MQRQDDQGGRLKRERKGVRVFLPTCSGCDVQRPIRESEQKLIRKSIFSFSKPFQKVYCQSMRQFGQAFPACCKCSEQQTEDCGSDIRVLKRLVVTLLTVPAHRGDAV